MGVTEILHPRPQEPHTNGSKVSIYVCCKGIANITNKNREKLKILCMKIYYLLDQTMHRDRIG